MTDILGAVNDFILAYCHKPDAGLLPLEQSQIVRGWQNVVSALPADSQEYAVLTLLGTQRHGTNVRQRRHAAGDTGLIETVSRLAEHMVQVDFCCAYPQQGETMARTRAEILEMLTRDRLAVEFLRKYKISACYADDVKPAPFQNESEQWEARYLVTLHLSAWTDIDVLIDSFDDVRAGINPAYGDYVENVDVHHPVTL